MSMDMQTELKSFLHATQRVDKLYYAALEWTAYFLNHSSNIFYSHHLVASIFNFTTQASKHHCCILEMWEWCLGSWHDEMPENMNSLL